MPSTIPPREHATRGRLSLLARVARAGFAGLLGCLGAVLFVVVVPTLANAGAADAGSEASASTDAADAEALDPAVARLNELAADVRALIEGHLAATVDAQSLFDVTLEDESAVAVEAARLGALLREVDPARRARRDGGTRRDAGDAEAGVMDVSPALWQARLDLDRARVAFYTLGAGERRELLAKHAEVDADATSGADQRAEVAAAQRELALKAARAARSEAERLVSEEYARLLDVERQQAEFEKKLIAQQKAIADRREATLGGQRRAREARATSSTADTADRTYDELRKALRAARDDLDNVLVEISTGASEVPEAGPDPLADLQTSVDTKAARAERERVEATALRLGAEEKRLHDERASQLLDEVDTLNAERLAMLPFLSSDKRSSVTGFTSAGIDQAASELRQLTLIVRYHRYALLAWLGALRDGGKGIGLGVGAGIFVVLELLAGIGAFVWARRRTPAALQSLRKRAEETDRHEGLTSPSLATRASAFALQIHRPLEWLVLALLLSWLLPAAAQRLLEVQLLTVIVQWVLGGALVVVVVNALAGTQAPTSAAETDTPALRLRSLRLVGRVVVAFGLVLVLTSRLVGPGTIYQWVRSVAWLASIPVFLVLVRWWREVVFQRAERARKPTAFEKWVLANREGWKSFLAATGGGVYLFVRGTLRAVRSWISRFNVTRSVLAYLFRRELGKLEAERAELETARLPDTAFDALGPEISRGDPVTTAIDTDIEGLVERLKARKGGVIALVGPLGMGKSLLLRKLHAQFPDTVLLTAPAEGEDALRAALGDKLGLSPHPPLEAAMDALAQSSMGRCLFLDDAHLFVQPFMGGLATFDKLLAGASRSSNHTTWVFAIDEVMWLFLKRARGARPLFDSVIQLRPWREEQIVELLCKRTEGAGLEPSFERLLEKLPPNADEIDKQEALDRRATSYYRMLWDYAAGNPGVALHMWRRSLGADPDGGTHVRFFQAPDTADLDNLPDQAVFVLRAVLQLAPATPEDIGRATMLNAADISDALRYAVARTYVAETDGRYRVTWTWLRAVSLFLQRRHLLGAS